MAPSRQKRSFDTWRMAEELCDKLSAACVLGDGSADKMAAAAPSETLLMACSGPFMRDRHKASENPAFARWRAERMPGAMGEKWLWEAACDTDDPSLAKTVTAESALAMFLESDCVKRKNRTLEASMLGALLGDGAFRMSRETTPWICEAPRDAGSAMAFLLFGPGNTRELSFSMEDGKPRFSHFDSFRPDADKIAKVLVDSIVSRHSNGETVGEFELSIAAVAAASSGLGKEAFADLCKCGWDASMAAGRSDVPTLFLRPRGMSVSGGFFGPLKKLAGRDGIMTEWMAKGASPAGAALLAGNREALVLFAKAGCPPIGSDQVRELSTAACSAMSHPSDDPDTSPIRLALFGPFANRSDIEGLLASSWDEASMSSDGFPETRTKRAGPSV